MHPADDEHYVADRQFGDRYLVDARRPPHFDAVFVQDRGIDVIDAGRAERHDFEIGQGGAHLIGKAVEADHRHLVALQEFHQIIALQHGAGFGELGAGVGGFKLGLKFREKSEISEDGGNFGHGWSS